MKLDSCRGRPCRNGLRIAQEVLTAGLTGLQSGFSFETLAELIPRRRNFCKIFFDKLKWQPSGFRNAESRGKETWFRLRIERFSRAGQSIGLTKPSSISFFLVGR